MSFTLINLEGGDVIEFAHFPPAIETEDEANWNEQDVPSRAKPLVYANRNPQQVIIDDLLLDRTDNHQSIVPLIKQLRNLILEIDGAPPALMICAGNWKQRVVLQHVQVRMEMFAPASGSPTRARVSLTFREIQPREAVTVNVVESEGAQ